MNTPNGLFFRSTAILLIALVLFSFDAAQAQQSKQNRKSSGQKSSCCSESSSAKERERKGVSSATAYSDSSLYQLKSRWTTHTGKTIALETLSGQVQVVAMIFTHCAFACPQIISDLKAIERRCDEIGVQKPHFTLISIDPERDTPRVLKSFAGKHQLDLSRWTLLVSKSSETREIAALLGVKYKKEANGDFSHSNIISVLNRKGEVIYQQQGLRQSPEASIEAIKKAQSSMAVIR